MHSCNGANWNVHGHHGSGGTGAAVQSFVDTRRDEGLVQVCEMVLGWLWHGMRACAWRGKAVTRRQCRGGAATALVALPPTALHPARSIAPHGKGMEDEHSSVSHSSEGLWLRPGRVQEPCYNHHAATKPAPTAAIPPPHFSSKPTAWPIRPPAASAPRSPVCAWCAASSRGCHPWRRRTAAGDGPRCRASRARRTSCCHWKAAGTAPCSAARAASCPG